MGAYGKVTWMTRDGTRYVESISLDGYPTFRVWDPRYIFQSRPDTGYVRIVTRTLDDGTVVFADLTVRGLRKLGIELDNLVPALPKTIRARYNCA